MILITGGFGFIGTHATRALLDAGERCVVVSRSTPAIPDDLAVRIGSDLFHERADVGDADRIAQVVAQHSVTGILHLAFGSPFPPSGDPIADMRVGIDGLLGILRAAVEHGVERVGIASTIGVYGGSDAPSPLSEDTPLPLAATHPIPAMKKIGELVGNQLAASTGLNLYSARIGGAWGPGGRPDARFFGAPQLVHAAVRGVEPDFSMLLSSPRAEDGLDLIYAPDCGQALARLQLAPILNHPVYNVGTGRETTYGEIASVLAQLVPGFTPALPGGANAPAVVMDVSRLRTDTGFEPQWHTAAAVGDYVAWLRAGNER